LFKQKLTPQQALQKAKHFCSYQERSHYEASEKLYSFGLRKIEVEPLISQLIEEGYLNEERFAAQFAGGKFRIKKWGRVKIQHELKQKRVSSFSIKKAMKEIDEDEYLKVLQQLTEQKWTALKGEQYLNRMAKTTQFLTQRGFESDLISKAISSIRQKEVH
jgi:regulatory protein